MNERCELIFVFDVKSMGLYGQAFAIAVLGNLVLRTIGRK